MQRNNSISNGLAEGLTGRTIRTASTLSGLAMLCLLNITAPAMAQEQVIILETPELNITGPQSEALFDFVASTPGVKRDGSVHLEGLNIIGPRGAG